MCWLSSHSGHQLIYSPFQARHSACAEVKSRRLVHIFPTAFIKQLERDWSQRYFKKYPPSMASLWSSRYWACATLNRDEKKTISVISRKRDVTSSETRQRGRRISSSREQSLPAFKQPAQTSWFRCSPTEQTDCRHHRKCLFLHEDTNWCQQLILL